MKIKPRARKQFDYFCSLGTDTPLDWPAGDCSALECFHVMESTGKRMGCCETPLLSKALNGKVAHGVTVKAVAEDFVGRIAFSKEIKENYLPSVADEIFRLAEKVAMEQLGFVPAFVRNRKDFTEYAALAL